MAPMGPAAPIRAFGVEARCCPSTEQTLNYCRRRLGSDLSSGRRTSSSAFGVILTVDALDGGGRRRMKHETFMLGLRPSFSSTDRAWRPGCRSRGRCTRRKRTRRHAGAGVSNSLPRR